MKAKTAEDRRPSHHRNKGLPSSGDDQLAVQHQLAASREIERQLGVDAETEPLEARRGRRGLTLDDLDLAGACGKLSGGWRFLRYALAVQNGEPVGEKGSPCAKPTRTRTSRPAPESTRRSAVRCHRRPSATSRPPECLMACSAMGSLGYATTEPGRSRSTRSAHSCRPAHVRAHGQPRRRAARSLPSLGSHPRRSPRRSST